MRGCGSHQSDEPHLYALTAFRGKAVEAVTPAFVAGIFFMHDAGSHNRYWEAVAPGSAKSVAMCLSAATAEGHRRRRHALGLLANQVHLAVHKARPGARRVSKGAVPAAARRADTGARKRLAARGSIARARACASQAL